MATNSFVRSAYILTLVFVIVTVSVTFTEGSPDPCGMEKEGTLCADCGDVCRRLEGYSGGYCRGEFWERICYCYSEREGCPDSEKYIKLTSG